MPICFCAIGCQHSTFNRMFGCVFLVWRHHLRKVNKSSVRTFRPFSAIFLSFGVPQYSNRLDYIKACDQRFTLTTKKSLHITFKSSDGSVWARRCRNRHDPFQGRTSCLATRPGFSFCITFRVSRRRRAMYSGHARLCVCMFVRRRIPALLHWPGCKSEEWERVPCLCTIGQICNRCTISLLW